jgi:hypothetical protein
VTDVDALFKLPSTEFTAARNALAAKLKKSGNAEEAERVKALTRPPVSAWTVNQLYWRHRKPFERLMAAGERFKQAQAAQLAGKSGDIRAPLEARREALAELSRLAAGLLEAAGHQPSPDTMRRVNTTLEALATYGSHPEAPQAGRLTDDVDPPGFEALAALIPRGRGDKRQDEATKVIPFRNDRPPKTKKKKLDPEEEERQREAERQAQIAAAKAAVQDAERALRDARKTAHEAESALKTAAARAKQAEKEKAEIEERYEKLNAAADAARQQARQVASDAEQAAQAVDDAELALQKAQRDLDQLS